MMPIIGLILVLVSLIGLDAIEVERKYGRH